MFEIPDDDDKFWEDLPLNDISNENVTPIKIPESEFKKNQPCSFNQNNFNKRRCIEQPQENQGRQFPNQDITSGQNVLSSLRDPDGGHNASKNNYTFQGMLSDSLRGPCLNIPPQPSRVLVPFTQEVALPRDPLLTRQRTPSGDTSVSEADLGSGHTSHSNNGRTSNKRKRKFPGPAGLLPRLGQGHTLDSPNVSKVKEDVVSPEQVIEKTDLILSSQSGEEVFNDRPWQTLLRDLQDDGQDTLQRFSLASSLQKAKKKQLPRGKVLFVMAVIETLEWLGKDASVTLKDKSGSIQGSIHQSLMKEYECDLQPGSVLVLRQVSVISPTSRNHYLNITPANVVCVYSNKSEGLTRLRFVDKDKALPTVLKDLEREMMAELTPQRPGTNTAQSRLNMGTPDIRNPQARLNMGTPDIRNPQSRLNMGTPNFRTPQSRLNMGTPDIRTPHSRFNMGTPDNRTPQSRFNVGNVRNNSVTPPKSYPVGARTPGIGLSGVQGSPVSRTGSFTPQRGPGQSVIPGNNGANISGVGVTRPPVGVSLSKTGPYTPQNVTDRNFTPQRFSTPDHQQRTPQRGAAPMNRIPVKGTTPMNRIPVGGTTPGNRIHVGGTTPGNNTPQGGSAPGNRIPVGGTTPGNRIPVGGTTPGNNTPQGGSAPGNSIPQGGATPGSITPTTPGVTNPYRFKPQNPGQNTFRPENQLEGNQSNFRISEAKSTVLSGYNTPKFPNTERTSSGGVDVSPSPFTNSHVTGRCRVSSSSAVSISAQHSKITTGCASVNTNSDNVSTTGVSPTNTTSSAVNTPNRKGFKFKSTKSLTSPDNSLGSSMGQKPGSFAPGGSTIIGSVPSMPDLLKESNNGVESLWQDDLSDDLLSQLSEELV